MKITQISAELIQFCGTDNTVADAARVSFNKMAKNYSDNQNVKLIQYLAKHKHFSPFNHCFVTFRIKAPLACARQLVKHRFMPWNEVSRRYVDEEPEFFFPEFYRSRSENVKQGSSVFPADYSVEEAISYTEFCLAEYNSRLSRGVAPEQARDCLPVNTMTEWWWSGTLGAYADMLKLRLDPHTQQESREVAEMIRDQLMPKFPISLNALLEYK